MDSRSSGTKSPRFALSGTTNIQRWRVATGYEAEGHDLGIVARATAICLRSLGFIAQHVPWSMCSKSQQRLLRRRHKTLKLWANGYSVLDGRLDITLDRSDDLRQTVLSVLSPMCKLLLKCLNSLPIPQPHLSELDSVCEDAEEVCNHMQLLVAGENGSASGDQSETSSECDTDESTASSVLFEEKIKEITVYVQCLIDLGTALQSPAVNDEQNDHAAVRTLHEHTANDYHADLISNKYPKANAPLVQRLGQISWARFLRMQNERSKSNTEREERLLSGVTKSLVSASEFQDSGLGASLPTSYAQSTVSYMTSISGGERVRIPPLPAEGKKGEPFDCTACGRSVRATINREWRKHLYADLQPYTCFYIGCQYSKTPFASHQLWSDHLELGHNLGPAWKPVECPLCLNLTGNGKNTILRHLARHMEDIALVALTPTVDSDEESQSEKSSGSKSATDSSSEAECGETDPGVPGYNQTASSAAFEAEVDAIMAESLLSVRQGDEHLDDQPSVHMPVLPFLTNGDMPLYTADAGIAAHQWTDVRCAARDSESVVAVQSYPSEQAASRCGYAECQAQFTGQFSRGNLSRHMRLVHNRRKFPCEVPGCYKIYRRQDGLQRHYDKKHPELPTQPKAPRDPQDTSQPNPEPSLSRKQATNHPPKIEEPPSQQQ